MKNRLVRLAAVLTAVIVMTVGFSAVSYAATHAISSVSIKVISNIEPGTRAGDLQINIGSEDGGDINVMAGSDSAAYYVRDAELGSGTSSGRIIHVGDTVKIRVWLSPADGSERTFNGSYSSSNVHVSGGTYQSSSKSGGDLAVTLTVKPVSGVYESPDDVSWRYPYSDNRSQIGRASWSQPEGTSGHYDITLMRGETAVHKIENYKGTSVNLYPWMTKAGEYSFKVRTVPSTDAEKKYGKKSEWSQSDEYYLDKEHVSDGTGQSDLNNNGTGTGNVTTAGWFQNGNVWYFRYPNGQLKKNGWEKIMDKWYYFDANGAMQTGWQTINGNTYLLGNDGAMQTGWQQSAGSWYYFNPDPAYGVEGAMMKNMWLLGTDGVSRYYLKDNGIMAQGWVDIGGNSYYFYPNNGVLAVNTVIDGTFRVGADGAWIH